MEQRNFVPITLTDAETPVQAPDLQARMARLNAILDGLGSVVVAYSGGVDSAFLLHAAHQRLGDRAVALTVVSPSLASSELEEAKAIAAKIGARHVLVSGHELDDPNYRANSPMRCYYCKTETFDLARTFADEEGFAAVVDGTNADDRGDHRPGRQAAREHGVRSPLLEAGLTKSDIRALSREAGLSTWDKPALACLASRIPYGTPVSAETLSQVERAEDAVRALGVRQLRVRHHGDVARIEVDPADFQRVIAHRGAIIVKLKALGYRYVTLDLAGFRSGSLNEALAPGEAHTI